MFSELVDKVIQRTGRPDMFADAIDYTNTILRKVHGKALWDRNFTSAEVTNHDRHHATNYMRWPRPLDLQVLRTIKVGECYLNYTRVGRHLENATDYYYMDGNEIIIVSRGICAATIGYYRRPERFIYFKPSERPAKFDRATDKWLYLVPDSDGEYTDQLVTEHEQNEARRKVSDWLLFEYPDLITHGVMNLLYSQLGDEQARSSYAIFREGVDDLIRVEEYSSTDN